MNSPAVGQFKVLLINPAPAGQVGKKQLKYHRRFPPLSFLTAAQMLKDQGMSVALMDLQISERYSLQEAVLRASDFDLIALTTSAYADWQCPMLRIEHILEQAHQLPSEKLVITGNHGTQFPKALMDLTRASYVIREEEEWALTALACALKEKKSLTEVPGLSFRNSQGEVIHNPSTKLPEMTNLPIPDYDLVAVSDYNYELLGGNFALLEASRGCPFSCHFCNRSMFQNKYRKHDFEKVSKALEILVEKKGCQSIYFFDLEFTINKKMVEDICQFIIARSYPQKYGFRWCCQTRADSVDFELCQLMKKAGCELIHFGVESGDPEILKSTNKRITLETIRTGIEAAHKARINSAAFFIYGHHQETAEQRNSTLNFALSLNPTYASFHALTPFPGSPLFEAKYGKGPYWEKPFPKSWGYHEPAYEAELIRFCKKSFLRYYLRPTYVWHALRHSSWSALLRQARLFLSFLRA